jgi:hypothetical protein
MAPALLAFNELGEPAEDEELGMKPVRVRAALVSPPLAGTLDGETEVTLGAGLEAAFDDAIVPNSVMSFITVPGLNLAASSPGAYFCPLLGPTRLMVWCSVGAGRLPVWPNGDGDVKSTRMDINK